MFLQREYRGFVDDMEQKDTFHKGIGMSFVSPVSRMGPRIQNIQLGPTKARQK